jgi:hypothetical protein
MWWDPGINRPGTRWQVSLNKPLPSDRSYINPSYSALCIYIFYLYLYIYIWIYLFSMYLSLSNRHLCLYMNWNIYVCTYKEVFTMQSAMFFQQKLVTSRCMFVCTSDYQWWRVPSYENVLCVIINTIVCKIDPRIKYLLEFCLQFIYRYIVVVTWIEYTPESVSYTTLVYSLISPW